jgi:hypothetical protein
MPNDARAQIQELVDDFANRLTLLLRRSALEQVVQALGGNGAAPARRGPGRPRGSTTVAAPARRSRGGKRTSEEMEAMSSALVSHVQANPGQRGEQIAQALGTDVKTMRLPMLKLIASKAITTRGQRRGMTYYPAGGAPRKVAGKPARKKGRRRSK